MTCSSHHLSINVRSVNVVSVQCQGLKFSLIAVPVTDDLANEEDSLSGGDKPAVTVGQHSCLSTQISGDKHPVHCI